MSSNVRTRPRRSLSLLRYGKRLAQLDNKVSSLLTTCIDELNKEFVQMLEQDKAWAHLAQYAVVDIKNNKISVRVEHPDAQALEYGTPDQPMVPRIREFMNIARDRISKDVETGIKEIYK